MFISASHKFALVHAPKTGGTSVSVSLDHCFDKVNDPANRHMPWACLTDYLTLEEIADYDRVVSVRNPWEWVLSNFLMLLKSPVLPEHRVVREMTFSEYVPWHFENHPMKMSDYLYAPAISDRLFPNIILRFERLADDFATFCVSKGIEAKLQHHNEGSTRGHYSSFYTPTTADLVAGTMAREIDDLGYEFERVEGPADHQDQLDKLVKAAECFYEGAHALNRNDAEHAAASLSEAVKLRPDDPKYLQHYSDALARLGHRDKAIELADRALELNPDNEIYHLHRRNLE